MKTCLTMGRQMMLLLISLVVGTFGRIAQGAEWQQGFDQRQIALIQIEGQDFPDQKTSAQFLDLMKNRGRIRWVLSKGSATSINPLTVPADFSWHASSSVRNLGLKFKVDGLVVLIKRGVQLEWRWYSTSDGLPLFFEKVVLPTAGPGQEEQRRKRLANWVSDVWSRIPGQGYVSKRDLQYIYIEGADQAGAAIGDELQFLRTLRIERHPLLKTLTKVATAVSGRGKVVELATPFSKVEIVYESKIDPIQVGDRYQIDVPKSKASSETTPTKSGGEKSQDAAKIEGSVEFKDEHGRRIVPLSEETVSVESPKASSMFNISGSLGFYNVNHKDILSTGTELALTKNFGPALAVNAALNLKKSWYIEGNYETAFFGFGGLPTDYSAESISSGLSAMRFSGGYRFFLEKHHDIRKSPFVKINLGWNRFTLTMEDLATAIAPTGKSYSGIEFSVGVAMPLVKSYLLNFDIRKNLTSSLTESGETAGSTAANSVWGAYFSLHDQWSDDSRLGGSLGFVSAQSDFTGDGTRSTPSTTTNTSAFSVYLTYQKFL